MLPASDVEKFFKNHLLQCRFMEYADEVRMSAVATAERDVCAALNLSELTGGYSKNIVAAICEQALYLLLNPDVVNSGSGSGLPHGLSERAGRLLGLDVPACRIVRG